MSQEPMRGLEPFLPHVLAWMDVHCTQAVGCLHHQHSKLIICLHCPHKTSISMEHLESPLNID